MHQCGAILANCGSVSRKLFEDSLSLFRFSVCFTADGLHASVWSRVSMLSPRRTTLQRKLHLIWLGDGARSNSGEMVQRQQG